MASFTHFVQEIDILKCNTGKVGVSPECVTAYIYKSFKYRSVFSSFADPEQTEQTVNVSGLSG